MMGASIKSLVNIYTYEAEDFEQQAIKIKKLFYQYKCKTVVIDATGLGIGLIDFMTKTQIDEETGMELPPFGVEGGSYEEALDQYRNINKMEGIEKHAMYLIKANAPLNTAAHANAQMQLSSGKIKFLIDERLASERLMSTREGQQISPSERAEYLIPFVQTSILKEQMVNLIGNNDGINIILKQANSKTKKDKFSAFEYGLYYIKEIDDNKKKRRKAGSFLEMMFFS